MLSIDPCLMKKQLFISLLALTLCMPAEVHAQQLTDKWVLTTRKNYNDPNTAGYNFDSLSPGSYDFDLLDDIGRPPYRGKSTLDPCHYDVDLALIEQDMAWDDQYPANCKLKTGILIRNNAVLTIDDALLEFGPDGKVIIEPGARINSNNSVFRNLNCEPYQKWKGIEVWGDKSISQYPDPNGMVHQGQLQLFNSTVMHAENGVALWAGEDKLWETAGGIVKAIQSNFLNNTRAVHFVPYVNTFPPTGDTCNNLSSFKLCNFSLDTNYIDSSMFWKHVDLAGVKGIGFYGCNFSLTSTSGVATWNKGIASYGSGFTVKEICDQPVVPCPAGDQIPSTFNGFYRAISAHGPMDDLKTYEVWNAEFTNNTIGIYNSLVPNAVMVGNDFEIGHNGTTDNINCAWAAGAGIEIFGANGYAIENNSFTKLPGAPPGYYIGVRLNSTMSVKDDVYKNTLTGLSVGNLAERNNRSDFIDDYYGVAYLCNENSNNTIDFHVTSDSSVIRGKMGSKDMPAGNTFSQNADWQFLNDYTQDIQYYYYTGDPLQVLTKFSDYIDTFAVTTENTCPDHYGGGGGINVVLTNAEKTNRELEYNLNMADYILTLDLINTLKDGGDTPLMEHEIETAWPEDMWDLRATLLANSPHLSFEVLKNVADRTDVFPESVQFDIFAANPDEMKRDFLTYLETKAQPMPQYMVDMLRQVGYGSSYKTVLKNQLAAYWGDAVQAAQDILRSELFDSISDMGEVRLWLGNIGGYQADKQIIAAYLQQGDFTSAQSLLSQLPSAYSLSGDDLPAYNDYNTMMQLQINLMLEGRNVFQLDSAELASVQDMAGFGYGDAKKIARGILEHAYNQHFYDCPSLPDSLTLKHHHPPVLFNRNDAIQISVKPNPASTWVAFDYTLPFSVDEGSILIIDMSGQIRENIRLHQNKEQKVLDTRLIPAGVYIYKVESSGYTSSGKLVIR